MSLNTLALADTIEGASAWTRDTISPDDWRLAFPAECVAELAQAVRATQGHAGALHTLGREGLELDACQAFAARLRGDYLDKGPLFALLDGLPAAGFTDTELTRAYWLFSGLVARPVEQTYQGTMMFDVRDTGVGGQMVPGSGIRATITNLDLNFHNDNCFNTAMPDYVGLLCLHPSRTGGISKVISFHTLHNILLAENPELLERLYQPIWWDRHREFGPGEAPYVANPVFEVANGRPRARFSNYNIRGGYRLREQALDPALEQAMQRLLALFARPELQCQFHMQAGQIQYVNNRAIAHARSEFQNGDTPEEQRHLVRLWLRAHGRVGYEG